MPDFLGVESLRCEDSNPFKTRPNVFSFTSNTSTRPGGATRCALLVGRLVVTLKGSALGALSLQGFRSKIPVLATQRREHGENRENHNIITLE
jgi:hypothetical protein